MANLENDKGQKNTSGVVTLIAAPLVFLVSNS